MTRGNEHDSKHPESAPAVPPSDVTRILTDQFASEQDRATKLLPLVYEELRALARARLAMERPGQTIQATALVHEAYLRLIGDADPGWSGRAHFFGAAAQAMRRILVDQARSRGRLKRGGDRARVELDEHEPPIDERGGGIETPATDVIAMDEAVKRLEAVDQRKAQIVSLRYFAGFTAEETAEVLGVSLGTIERDWRFIKAWLREELDRQTERS